MLSVLKSHPFSLILYNIYITIYKLYNIIQINKFKKSYALTKNSEAFCYVVLDQILKISGTEISDAITDGGDDRGIDAVYIDERLGVNTIHLFQFKHHSKYHT